MNTPDQAPKDGDFVAYLADLERRQLLGHRPLEVPPLNAPPAKGGAKPPAMSRPVTPGGSAAATTISPDAAIELVRSLPLGLLAVGLVLFVAGLAINGGGFLVLIGALMLAQAVRAVLKAAKDRSTTPAQQVAALLSGHVQTKPPQK